MRYRIVHLEVGPDFLEPREYVFVATNLLAGNFSYPRIRLEFARQMRRTMIGFRPYEPQLFD
jgi:hypothetical protein